jgi:hypothetical protein
MQFDFEEVLKQRLKLAFKGFELIVANGGAGDAKAIFEEGLRAGVMAYASTIQIKEQIEQQNNG